jgi:MFS family permease
MSNTPATPADPVLTTDATGDQEVPQGGPPSEDRARRGRLYGFRALKSPGFRIYFVGMLLRGMAMWMPLVAIPWLAVELGATPAEVGVVSAFFFLPTLVVGPMGGVLADRVERRRVLIITQLLASFFAGGLAVAIIAGMQTMPMLAAFSFAFGMLIAIEVPVRQAYMTELVPRRDIPSAASLHATAWNTSRLFGPVFAGVMIAAIGSAAPFVFGAIVSLLVAASILWMDRYREPGRQRTDTSQSILADLREGAAFAWSEPIVRWSLILIWAVAMFGIATFITLAPIYAPQELGVGAGGYGAFLGASGAGALTAALLVTAFARGDRRPWLIAGVFAMSALIAGLSLVTAVPAAFVIAFLLGASQITLAQNALVSVQSATPDRLRGRVMGIWVMTFQGSSLFGAIAAGWLAEVLGVRGAMFIGAMALAVVGVVAVFALRRVDWRLAPKLAAASSA